MRKSLTVEFINSILELQKEELYWKKTRGPKALKGKKAGYLQTCNGITYKRIRINNYSYIYKSIVEFIKTEKWSIKETKPKWKSKQIEFCKCGCENKVSKGKVYFYSRQCGINYHSKLVQLTTSKIFKYCKCGCGEILKCKKSSFGSPEHKLKHNTGKVVSVKNLQKPITNCLLCVSPHLEN